MDSEPAEVGDPAPLAECLELHQAGGSTVGLDHEHAGGSRLALRPLDPGEHVRALAAPVHGEEGLDLLVGQQAGDEVDIGALGAAEPDADAFGVTRSPRTRAASFAVAFVLGFVSHAAGSATGRR